MPQGKAKKHQLAPGAQLTKKRKHTGAIQKKKHVPGGGARGQSRGSAAVANMKDGFQKAVNARIEEEVSQRAQACEPKSFALLKSGAPTVSSGSSTTKNQDAKPNFGNKRKTKKTSKKGKMKA